ncbi:MAG: cupin domain-containing protein [Geitlerinemataceae cyanobacterium]
MSDYCTIAVSRSIRDYQAFRISPEDTNRLAIVFDPETADRSLAVCVEIFDVGGKTPPNRHQMAVEMFFVLKGKGVAYCEGKVVKIESGDSLLVPPTGIHEIWNLGTERLYLLCIMIPNEDFIELIRRGIPAELDDEDWLVLRRSDLRIPVAI